MVGGGVEHRLVMGRFAPVLALARPSATAPSSPVMTRRAKTDLQQIETLTDGELLQLLIGRRTGSNELLSTHGSLHALIRALPKTGNTRMTARLAAALEVAKRHYAADMLAGESLHSPGETSRFLISRLRDRPFEVFCCLYLDARHRLIAFEELFRGTIDGASVHPREVVRQALAHNAASLIFAHNHPSGVAEPSRADELITLRLRDALGLVDIRVLDHLIVAGPRVVSLAEKGLI